MDRPTVHVACEQCHLMERDHESGGEGGRPRPVVSAAPLRAEESLREEHEEVVDEELSPATTPVNSASHSSSRESNSSSEHSERELDEFSIVGEAIKCALKTDIPSRRGVEVKKRVAEDDTDPFSRLPQEILDMILDMVDWNTIIQCMAVSRTWSYNIKSNSRVWRRHLPPGQGGLDWQQFLAIKKENFRWQTGMYKQWCLKIEDTDPRVNSEMILESTETYIFIAFLDSLYRFHTKNHNLSTIPTYSKVIGLHAFSDRLGMVTDSDILGTYYITIFSEELDQSVVFKMTNVTVGARAGKLCFIYRDRLSVFSADTNSTLEYQVPPGLVTELVPSHDTIVAKTLHGGSSVSPYFEVYTLRMAEGNWTRTYRSHSDSPMGHIIGRIDVLKENILVVESLQSDDIYRYIFFMIAFDVINPLGELRDSRWPYFCFHMTEDTLAYMASDSLLKTVQLTERGLASRMEVKPGVIMMWTREHNIILVYKNHWEYWSMTNHGPNHVKKYSTWVKLEIDNSKITKDYFVISSGHEVILYYFTESETAEPHFAASRLQIFLK